MEIIIGLNVFLVVVVGYLHHHITKVNSEINLMKSTINKVVDNQNVNNLEIIDAKIHNIYLMYRVGNITTGGAVEMIKKFEKLSPQLVRFIIEMIKGTERIKEQERNAKEDN